MLFLRRAVAVFGVIILAVGLLQSVFPNAAIDLSRGLMESDYAMRLIGLVACFFGVVLLIAGRRRAVGLNVFTEVLGWITAVAGAVMVVYPSPLLSVFHTLVFDAPRSTQMRVVLSGGVVRTVLGLLLLYAAARPAASEMPSRPAV